MKMKRKSRVADQSSRTVFGAASRIFATISVSLSAALSTSPAQSLEIEEIVVTARKRAESMQEVPIAISSFSGEALKMSGVEDVSDVSLHTPNLMFTFSGSSDSTIKPAIRAQSQNSNVSTLDASVGIYVDGVIWPRPIGADMNLADIDSVEVLRGPQGTLFGRNTTGGAIQIATNDPVFDTRARVGVRIGNHDRRDYNLMVNVPLAEDHLALRVAYDVQKRDGWQENLFDGHESGQRDTSNLIAKLLFRPREGLEFLLKFDRNKGDHIMRDWLMSFFDQQNGAPAFGGLDPIAVLTGGAATASEFVSTDYENPRTTPEHIGVTTWKHQGVALTTTWDPDPDLSIKAIAAYRELDEWTDNHDYDATPVPFLNNSIGLEGHRMWSIELQVNGSSLSNKLQWTAGLFALEEEGRDKSFFGFGFPFEQHTKGDVENTGQAIFAQADYRLSEKLTATFGLRYSKESKDLTSYNQLTFAADRSFMRCLVPSLFTGVEDPTIESGCKAKFDREDDSVDYTAMLAYDLMPGKMVYIKTASGFRSGGQNLRGGLPFAEDTPASIASFRDFAPEEVVEYEAGLKADWFDSRLRTNLAAFYSDYQDIQRSTIVARAGGIATLVSNAAEATVQGVEAEITGILAEGWNLGATFGWTDAEYDKFDDFDAQGNPIDRSGEPFLSTPEYTYSFWSVYTREMPIGEASFRVDYSWQDKHYTYSTAGQGIATPPRGLWNGRIQWNISKQFEIALWGKNLNDEVFRHYAIDLFQSYGFALAIGNTPRMWGMEMTYRFGE
jgi:iron complex outermembrane receptor protein